MLVCDKAALDGEVLSFLALAVDFLFFFDAEAFFFFLLVVECWDGDFFDDFGGGALKGGFVGAFCGGVARAA